MTTMTSTMMTMTMTTTMMMATTATTGMMVVESSDNDDDGECFFSRYFFQVLQTGRTHRNATQLSIELNSKNQVLQTFFRFRQISNPKNLLADAETYEGIRSYMREGARVAFTFNGPVSFSKIGQNTGRQPTTLQVPMVHHACSRDDHHACPMVHTL